MTYLPSSRISLPAPATPPSVVQTQVLSSLDFPYASSPWPSKEIRQLELSISERRKKRTRKNPEEEQPEYRCKEFAIPESHFIGALPRALVSRIIQYVGGARPNYFEICWAWRHKQVNTSRAPGLQLESELPPDCGISFKGGHSTVLPLRPNVPYLRRPFPLIGIEDGQALRAPEDVHFVDHAFTTKVIGEHEILHSVWRFHAKKWMVAQRIIYFLSVCVHQVPTGVPSEKVGKGNLITAFLEAFRRDGEEIHGCCRECLTDFMIQSSENCTTVYAWQYLRSLASKPYGTLMRIKTPNIGRAKTKGHGYTDRLLAGLVRDMEQPGEVRLFYNQAVEVLTQRDVIFLCQGGVFLVRTKSDGNKPRKWVAPRCECSNNASEPCEGVAWKTWHAESRKRLPRPKKKKQSSPDEPGLESGDEIDDSCDDDDEDDDDTASDTGENEEDDPVISDNISTGNHGRQSSNLKRQRGVDGFGESEQGNLANRAAVPRDNEYVATLARTMEINLANAACKLRDRN